MIQRGQKLGSVCGGQGLHLEPGGAAGGQGRAWGVWIEKSGPGRFPSSSVSQVGSLKFLNVPQVNYLLGIEECVIMPPRSPFPRKTDDIAANTY